MNEMDLSGMDLNEAAMADGEGRLAPSADLAKEHGTHDKETDKDGLDDVDRS